jgi:predicted Zn-dependent protease with MMP-like domain
LTVQADEEKQDFEKIVANAFANVPDDFKHQVYELAVNSAKEVSVERLTECLTVAIKVLLDFIESEDQTEELLKTASEQW